MAAPTIAAGLRQLLTTYVPFSAMSAADVDFVIENVEIGYFAPDEVVLAPSGSLPGHCLIVKQGRVQGEAPDKEGIAFEAGVGDCFPVSALAGGMTNFMSFRKPHWNPDYTPHHLMEDIEKYKLLPGIGATQHFCQDLAIGLELGWGGLLAKIRAYRALNEPNGADFYAGLEDVVLGMQDWIRRTAAA